MLLGVISIAAGSAAVRLRRRLVPNASGSAALLYSAIVAVSLLVVVSEILGAAGVLRRWPLVLSVVAVAAVLNVVIRTPRSPGREAKPTLGKVALLTTIIVLAVAAQWIAWTAGGFAHGSTDTDTVRYHLPLAAQFARTGSLTHLQFVDVD